MLCHYVLPSITPTNIFQIAPSWFSAFWLCLTLYNIPNAPTTYSTDIPFVLALLEDFLFDWIKTKWNAYCIAILKHPQSPFSFRRHRQWCDDAHPYLWVRMSTQWKNLEVTESLNDGDGGYGGIVEQEPMFQRKTARYRESKLLSWLFCFSFVRWTVVICGLSIPVLIQNHRIQK